jgi:SAM-dependent methyltransferase
MRRTVTHELLDDDAGTPAEVAASLADLRRFNRWFGGSSTTFRMLRRVADRTGARELSLLDVAGATGDVAHYAQARLLRLGVRLEVTLLDRAATHLAREFPAVAGDALQLPFADGSFDLVTNSLLVHQLAPDEVARFVDEALRVCRTAVLINDLRRSALHLAAVYAGFPLYRSRLTRHDAPASVRQAYTVEELRHLLGRGARLEIERSYFFRVGAILWKREPGPR